MKNNEKQENVFANLWDEMFLKIPPPPISKKNRHQNPVIFLLYKPNRQKRGISSILNPELNISKRRKLKMLKGALSTCLSFK